MPSNLRVKHQNTTDEWRYFSIFWKTILLTALRNKKPWATELTIIFLIKDKRYLFLIPYHNITAYDMIFIFNTISYAVMLGDLLKDIPTNINFLTFYFEVVLLKIKNCSIMTKTPHASSLEFFPINITFIVQTQKDQMDAVSHATTAQCQVPPGRYIGHPLALSQLSLQVQPRLLQADDKLSSFLLPVLLFQNFSSSLE